MYEVVPHQDQKPKGPKPLAKEIIWQWCWIFIFLTWLELKRLLTVRIIIFNHNSYKKNCYYWFCYRGPSLQAQDTCSDFFQFSYVFTATCLIFTLPGSLDIKYGSYARSNQVPDDIQIIELSWSRQMTYSDWYRGDRPPHSKYQICSSVHTRGKKSSKAKSTEGSAPKKRFLELSPK